MEDLKKDFQQLMGIFFQMSIPLMKNQYEFNCQVVEEATNNPINDEYGNDEALSYFKGTMYHDERALNYLQQFQQMNFQDFLCQFQVISQGKHFNYNSSDFDSLFIIDKQKQKEMKQRDDESHSYVVFYSGDIDDNGEMQRMLLQQLVRKILILLDKMEIYQHKILQANLLKQKIKKIGLRWEVYNHIFEEMMN